jgi:hypothetical protein
MQNCDAVVENYFVWVQSVKPFYKQFFLGSKNEDGSHKLAMVGSISLGNIVALGKWAQVQSKHCFPHASGF